MPNYKEAIIPRVQVLPPFDAELEAAVESALAKLDQRSAPPVRRQSITASHGVAALLGGSIGALAVLMFRPPTVLEKVVTVEKPLVVEQPTIIEKPVPVDTNCLLWCK